jgi:hypothetical protein
MFSTMPRIGTSVLRNMATPRLASIRARSCGVETMTAPASGVACAIVSWASPVPGRHVDDEHVELAPGDLAQHLGDGAHHHRAAPDHRRLFLDEEADGHDLDAEALQRREGAPLTTRGLPCRPNSLGSEGP